MGLQVNCKSNYTKVLQGLETFRSFFNFLYKNLAIEVEASGDPIRHPQYNIKDYVDERFLHYDFDKCNLYASYLAIYYKMATAWINFLKNDFCIQQSDDGNTGIIKWGARAFERFFFHMDSDAAYIIFPHLFSLLV